MPGRKRKKPHRILQYIADTLKNRLDELGMTRYRFVVDNPDIISHPGLSKLYHAKQGTSVMMLHDVLDRLDMEIIIEKRERQKSKEETLTIEQTTKLFELGFDTKGILYPSVGDLVNWLPKSISLKQEFFISYDKVNNNWIVGYQHTFNTCSSPRLIDALFQLLLRVIENDIKEI